MSKGVNRTGLYDALQVVNKLVDHRSAHRAITVVRLEAKNGMLNLRATNLNEYIDIDLDYDGELSACTLLPKPLAELVKPEDRKDSGSVSLECDGDKILVKLARLTVELTQACSIEDLPEFEDQSWDRIGEYGSKQLARDLRFLEPAILRDDTRAFLCRLSFEKNQITSTDGHRVHRADSSLEFPDRLLMPRRAVNVLQKCLRHGDSVTFYRNSSVVSRVVVGSYSLVFSSSDDIFPLVDRAIPQFCDITVTIDAKELTKSIKLIRSLAVKDNPDVMESVVISVTEDELFVKSYDDSSVATITLVPEKIEMDEPERDPAIEVRLQSKYVLEALAGARGMAELKFLESLDPVIVQQDDRFAIVMPMRI